MTKSLVTISQCDKKPVTLRVFFLQHRCFWRGRDPWKTCEWRSHKSQLRNEENCLWRKTTLVPVCSEEHISGRGDNLQLWGLLLSVALKGMFMSDYMLAFEFGFKYFLLFIYLHGKTRQQKQQQQKSRSKLCRWDLENP